MSKFLLQISKMASLSTKNYASSIKNGFKGNSAVLIIGAFGGCKDSVVRFNDTRGNQR